MTYAGRKSYLIYQMIGMTLARFQKLKVGSNFILGIYMQESVTMGPVSHITSNFK